MKHENTGPVSTLARIKTSFMPPPWSKENDDKLFEMARDSFEKRGVIYAALVAFSSETGIGLDAVQRRMHLISRQTVREPKKSEIN